MVIGTTFTIVLILVITIWILVELKRFKHKIWAIFIIILILFTYVSFVSTVKGKNIDFTSVDGVKTAGSLYFSWLGSVFSNLKTITANAIDMNWKVDDINTASNSSVK